MLKKQQKENFRLPCCDKKDELSTGKEMGGNDDNIEMFVYNQEGKIKTSLKIVVCTFKVSQILISKALWKIIDAI